MFATNLGISFFSRPVEDSQWTVATIRPWSSLWTSRLQEVVSFWIPLPPPTETVLYIVCDARSVPVFGSVVISRNPSCRSSDSEAVNRASTVVIPAGTTATPDSTTASDGTLAKARAARNPATRKKHGGPPAARSRARQFLFSSRVQHGGIIFLAPPAGVSQVSPSRDPSE